MQPKQYVMTHPRDAAVPVAPLLGLQGGRLRALARVAHARVDLTFAFVRRELGIRYKEAYVGVGWALLQPLAYMGIFTVLFSRMAHVQGSGALSSYVALVPWSFAATAILQGGQSVFNQLGVVSKIYFPRSVLPLAAVIAAAVDGVIAFGLQLGLMAATGARFGATLLLWPVLMLLTGLVSLGIALVLAPAVVRFRDLRYVIPVGVQLLLLATPVGYPLSALPATYRRLAALNPYAGLMDAFRAIAIRGETPPLQDVWPAVVWAVVLLVLGGVYFRREEATVADYV